MNQRELFKKFIAEDDIVFDIGAFDGTLSEFFAGIVGDKGQVHAFEPHSEHFKTVKSKSDKSTIIRSYNNAVSDKEETVTFYMGNEGFSEQASTICKHLANEDRLGEQFRKSEVESIVIDNFIKENAIIPNFIKIDVEGAENLVFKGCSSLLQEHKPIIYFEFGFFHDQVISTDHLDFLRQNGYKVFVSDFCQFVGNTLSWDNIKNTDNEKLNQYIYSFNDQSLLSAAPFAGNAVALTDAQIADLKVEIFPIEEAVKLLSCPKRTFRQKVKRCLPNIPKLYEWFLNHMRK